MARCNTAARHPIRVALTGALLLSVLSLTRSPAAAQRMPRTVPHALALPAGLAPIVARTLRRGVDTPHIAPAGPWSQQAEIIAPDGVGGDQFSYSVALSGTTALIGALQKNGSTGAVYVFVRSGTSWSQQAEITATDGTSDDFFGWTVALSGNTALIGTPFQIGNTALIGTPFQIGNTGAAYVFARNGTSWSQQAELNPTFGGGPAAVGAGSSVALSSDGNTALIGADGTNNGTGAVYAFMRPVIYLSPSSGTVGTSVTLVGLAFAAKEKVLALWYVNPGVSQVGSTMSNGAGTVVMRFTVPASAPGTHLVIGYGVSSFGEVAVAPFKVIASISRAPVNAS